MIRIKRGRLRKGGAGGKTKAGETAAPRLPAAPNPAPRSGSGYNGAPAAPQETCRRVLALARLLGAPLSRERSERIVRPTYMKRPPREGFHHCG